MENVEIILNEWEYASLNRERIGNRNLFNSREITSSGELDGTGFGVSGCSGVGNEDCSGGGEDDYQYGYTESGELDCSGWNETEWMIQ